MNGLALCAGIGGLDLGVRIAASDYRTVCYVEREAFAAATLVAQMENGSMAPAPIWDDLFTFDGRRWRGVVDIVTAGIPCQPYSVAGKRRGHDDERALWPEFIRIVEESAPTLVFLENVAAFIHYFRPVGERLSDLGYRLEAGIFSASEVGAPHRRERFFMLAHHPSRRVGGLSVRSGQSRQADSNSDGCDTSMAVTERARRAARIGCDEHAGSSVGDTDESRLEGYGADGERADERPPWPPGPADRLGWSRVPRSLWPAISDADRQPSNGPSKPRTEHSDEKAQSAICKLADGPADRTNQLRALGNGVVPLQAAFALTTLARRVGIDLDAGAC